MTNEENWHQSCFYDAGKLIESQPGGDGKMMKTAATILAMLLTMPVSYAILDQVSRKIRLKDRVKA